MRVLTRARGYVFGLPGLASMIPLWVHMSSLPSVRLGQIVLRSCRVTYTSRLVTCWSRVLAASPWVR
nr:MAG TPA: catestatin choromogranin A [Caudoviricetes sp.]